MLIGLLSLPGVVFHELGHYVFCRLAGARVHEVVFFRFGNPAGYVVHTAPKHFREHFAIVVGPFLVNSAVGFALFWSVTSRWGKALSVSDLQSLALATAALWLGTSVSLQAFPSKGDARSLWQVANRHLRHGNILAALGYPAVGTIFLVNLLRILRLDWIYTGALLVLSVWVI
ncbi:MAG: DUF3267 domain-containing protein [Chloroflexi bacterium]|nr:DUF3267 domain-containing protein [Chloroflexota bacterium]